MCLEKEVLEKAEQMVQVAPWWIMVDGANWQHPEGPKPGPTKFLKIVFFILKDIYCFDLFLELCSRET